MRREFSGLNEILQKREQIELQMEIEWFESLLESLESGHYDVAIELVGSAVKLKKRQLER